MAAGGVHYKLSYFGIPGRAHCIRAALYIGDVAFEDELLDFKTFGARKAGGELPWTGVPVLTIMEDGSNKELFRIGQSNAILNFACKLAGLFPKDNISALRSDEILAACEDMPAVFNASNAEKDADKKAAMNKEICDGALALWLGRFDRRLKENKTGYFVGNDLSPADLKAYFSFQFITSGFMPGIPKDLFDKYENITAFFKKMESHEKFMKFVREFNEKNKH